MKELATAEIAVVGMGLMGGSLAGALRGRCRAVIGVSRRPEATRTAIDRGLVDAATEELAAGVKQADVVILATPVRTILRQLDEIGPLLPPGCLLMDLGSTKAEIVARMAALPEHVQPLGGHPMCGKEVAGIEAAEPAMLRGRPFLLTPLPRTSAEALALGRAIVQASGARPLVVDPERHDRLVAAISHLPYLLACGLVLTAETAAVDDSLVWQVAAGGFRDTSRLAASDVTMMMDILLTNHAPVSESLATLAEQLGELGRLIESGDEETLRQALQSVHDRRKGLVL